MKEYEVTVTISYKTIIQYVDNEDEAQDKALEELSQNLYSWSDVLVEEITK